MTTYTTDDQYPEGGNFKPGDICECTNTAYPISSWIYTGREWVPNSPTVTTNPFTGGVDFFHEGKRVRSMDRSGWQAAALTPSKQFRQAKKRMVKGGRCFYPFTDHSVITKGGTNAANVTLSTVSGYNGLTEDGSGSRTGSPSMVKVVGDAGATGTITLTIPAASITPANVNGKIGIWIYQNYADASQPTINVSWSTNATISGELNTFWNNNQVRPGWNFLVFDQKASAHPLGIGVAYAGADLVANQLKCFRIEFSSLASRTFYLDSSWYDFDQTPRIVLGWDSADQDVIDFVLPEMTSRGWRGYIAEPCFVWSAGSTRYDNFSGAGARESRIDTFAAAGWDMINHSTTHRQIGSLTNDYEIRYEVENHKAWALAHGWEKGCEFYASPQSSTSPLAERVIRESGICLQRHGKKRNVHVTPWGVDNPGHIGSFDMGNQTFAAIKAVIDANLAYKSDTFLFGHNTVAGGSADGSTVPGDSMQMYRTTLLLVLDYIKSLETAGSVVVPDGMTGWYYG